MQKVEISVAVKALNPKAFVVKSAEGETLFSYGAPVVHTTPEGKVFIDAVAWGRSKSTSMHLIAYTGKDKEALTKEILAGNIELASLIAPNVEVAPSEVKKEPKQAE